MEAPTFQDVLRARQVVNRYLPRTPLIQPPALSKVLGCRAYLKCENLQPIGSFKIRGGLNLISSLSPEERQRGVITASTGNHGQSVAYAARQFGLPAIIFAPEGSNPLKMEAMRQLGAEVVFHGKDFDEARLRAEELARQEGYRYIHPVNEPLLIAGVATASLEIIEELPDLDVIILPIGAGSEACGACIVAKAVNRSIKVIGVQAGGAPAVYLSWRHKRLMSTEAAATFAEGLATRVAFELPFRILCQHIDDIVLVSDDELRQAILMLLECAHQLAEAAGAASTAAAYKLREHLAGKTVALMLSGGNITLESLREILNASR